MEIKVRNLDAIVVKKIDELAKSKGQSRNQYLKHQLESFAIEGLNSELIKRYESQLNANMMLLEKTNNTLIELTDIFKELMDNE